MIYEKSENVKIEHIFQSGGKKTFNTCCYEFKKDNRLDRYIVLKNGDLSNGAYVRVASMCLGHVFHFARCDCYDQLPLALEEIANKANSILIYGLDQDGRAHGPLEHINAIKRMDEYREHTYDALPDVRDYKHVAQILKDMGLTKIRLYTNNPDKTKALKKQGFEVEQIPLESAVREENKRLMEQKRERGHRLRLDGDPHIG